jgi:hypothetical protein
VWVQSHVTSKTAAILNCCVHWLLSFVIRKINSGVFTHMLAFNIQAFMRDDFIATLNLIPIHLCKIAFFS